MIVRTKLRQNQKKLIFWSKNTVNTRIMLPVFSFKRTKRVFWNNLKKNQIEHVPNNDTLLWP